MPITESRRMTNCKTQRGFTLLEALIGLVLMVMIMGMVFTFYVNTSKLAKSERSGQEMVQGARVAIDELSRNLQQVGYGIDRPDAMNPGEWQRSVIHAGAHTFAFNADLDPDIGPIGVTQTLTFPGGETYVGEGHSTSVSGAEAYVYTIDANADNAITAADRSSAESGGFNPAAGTDNPLDYALFRRRYGYDGTGYQTESTAIMANLFTNALDSTQYPDGATPAPLFTYTLTEDLDRNGILEDDECVNDVVDSCPPSTARDPLTYIWGDTNFDGELSDTERDALRTMPVGSPNWSKNRLVSSGAYRSTSLTAAIDPDDPYAYVAKVTDGTQISNGSVVKLGTGSDAEHAIVTNVITSTTPHQVFFSTGPSNAHAISTTMEIVPLSLLRAIRAVNVNFVAMTPKKDSETDRTPAGQAGRATSHGMKYRTLLMERSIELTNIETMPVRPGWVTSGKGPLPCPLKVSAVCNDADLTSVNAMVGASVPVRFKVTDLQGNGVEGAQVVYSRTGSASGALSSGFDRTDGYGETNLVFTPTGVTGTATITATATCEGTDYSDSLDVVVQRIDLSVENDCLVTVSSRTPTPTTNFTAEVWNSDGIVKDAPLELRLHVSEEVLSPLDFTNVQAELYDSFSFAGSTDTTGWSATHETDTGGSGTLSGSVKLVKDNSDGGVRIQLIGSTPRVECSSYGADLQVPITFYDFELQSVTPVSGCTESNPCTIPAYGDAPEIYAELSLAGRLVKNTPVEFSAVDTVKVVTDPPAESVLDPGAIVYTNDSGRAEAAVANNSVETITPATPLSTVIDVTSQGESLMCTSGTITAGTPKLGFIYEGPSKVSTCSLVSDSSWGLTPDRENKLCINAFNPNELGECGLYPTGIAVTLYELDGVTPVDFGVEKIEGGAVTASPYCGDPKVTLFRHDWCNRGGKLLMPGERYDFRNEGDCEMPQNEVGAQQYFVIKKIQFAKDFEKGQRVDVTLFFDCTGTCDTKTDMSTTLELVID